MSLCTQSAWYALNYQYKDWYFENYPWLKEFPPKHSDLIDFYEDDMKARNLTPLDSFKNCYEFVLSYALENLPKVGQEGRFMGQTFWQRLVKDQWIGESSLWTALKKTGSSLTANILVPVAVAFLLLYALKD